MSEISVVILITCLVGSLIGTYLLMPRIIGVVTYKRLMDNPNSRSSHQEKVPSLGGIAFFIVFTLGLYILQPVDDYNIAMSLLPPLVILFIIGLKDDLVVLSPLTKLIAQVISSSFVLFNPNFHIESLNNFFGITEIPSLISIPLAAFVMLFVINAFNLIDGIDGLASMVGILIFSVYGVLFFMLGLYFFLGVSLLGIGSLIAFLRFNLSAQKKIFMGDTGSLILGFIIASASIRILSLEPILLKKLPFQLENLPLVVIAVLIIPVFDTARVFTVRLINGKHPFSADRNHIHHILIDYLKMSHRKASVTLGIANGLFVLIFAFLGINFDNLIVLGILALCVAIFVYFFFRINSHKNLRRRLRIKKNLKRLQVKGNLFNF